MNDSSSDTTVDDRTSNSQLGRLTTPVAQETPNTTDHPTPNTDPTDNGNDSSQHTSTPAPGPLQKRRRVTRACDECRRKKIKCDGKQPCNHCVVYGYECTYDQPSNRRRNNATPQYVEALETQLKRARALLSAVIPSNQIDLSDPSLDARLQSGLLPKGQPIDKGPPPTAATGSLAAIAPAKAPEDDSEQIESMVRSTGNLELDDDGKWDYHGHSSGFSFIRRMREQLGEVMGPVADGGAMPFLKSRPMSVVFDSPRSNLDSPMTEGMSVQSDSVELPSKEVAMRMLDSGLNDASSLLRIVHAPSFYKMVNKVYDTPPESYSQEENQFLPLLYSVLAVGSLFSKNYKEIDAIGYEFAIDEGFKYFKAARQLMDIADCRDLTALQAIIFMILFLQSSAKLATCYSYVGVALRSALRMGMHRSFNHNFSPIEAEVRKRCFWVIRKMDIYVGALIGLPHTLSDLDVDQDQPMEVDDEFITEDGILPMPEGRVSLLTAANAHTRLVTILSRIVRHIYPIKSTAAAAQQGLASKRYSVSLSKIREIERELANWLEELPNGLKPGGEAPFIIKRCQQLLRMAFAHAQMMLYRPFIHFVSKKFNRKGINPSAYACAAAGISVSRNIVHIIAEMKKNGFLIGAYWFSCYTTFFAVMSLVYYVMENQDDPSSWDVMKDALQGKELLAQLAKRSLAADRCSSTLEPMFDRIPEHLKKPSEFALPKKRRQAPSVAPSRSTPAVPDFISEFGPPRRAHTFPEQANSSNTAKRASFPASIAGSAPSQTSYAGSPYLQSPHTSISDNFDTSTVPTPLSTSASTTFSLPIQHSGASLSQRQQLDETFGISGGSLMHGNEEYTNAVPDITAMMFPSGDPFAYPNQPMMTFENTQNPSAVQGLVSAGNPMHSNQRFEFANVRQHSNSPRISLPGSNDAFSADPSQNPDDIQLFGTMPMYLMPHQTTGIARDPSTTQPSYMNPTAAQMSGLGQKSMPGSSLAETHSGLAAQQHPLGPQPFLHDGDMNVNDVFAPGEEWTGTFMDPGFGYGFGR